MEDKLEKRASEMKKALTNAANKRGDLLKRRSHIKEKIVQWEEKGVSYQAREQELIQKLATIKKQSAESLMDGKTPEEIFQGQREISTELEAVQGALKEIESNILPRANEELKQIEKSVFEALNQDVNMVHSKYQEIFEKKLKEMIEVDMLAWGRAISEFTQEMNTGSFRNRLRVRNRTIENDVF